MFSVGFFPPFVVGALSLWLLLNAFFASARAFPQTRWRLFALTCVDVPTIVLAFSVLVLGGAGISRSCVYVPAAVCDCLPCLVRSRLAGSLRLRSQLAFRHLLPLLFAVVPSLPVGSFNFVLCAGSSPAPSPFAVSPLGFNASRRLTYALRAFAPSISGHQARCSHVSPLALTR